MSISISALASSISLAYGLRASWHPEITKQVIAAGMTVGTHTWSHKDLARNPYAKDIELAKAEIEMGISAVGWRGRDLTAG